MQIGIKGVARKEQRKRSLSPRNPGKFAKDEEQPMPQPIMIDISRLLKFSLNFSKFVQTFANFSKITNINLIYNTVYVNN